MAADIINWIGALICFIAAFKIITKPDVSRKGIISNYIQVLVDSEKLMSSSDRIVLMKKRLDDLVVADIPKWQQEAFVLAVLEKFKI